MSTKTARNLSCQGRLTGEDLVGHFVFVLLSFIFLLLLLLIGGGEKMVSSPQHQALPFLPTEAVPSSTPTPCQATHLLCKSPLSPFGTCYVGFKG